MRHRSLLLAALAYSFYGCDCGESPTEGGGPRDLPLLIGEGEVLPDTGAPSPDVEAPDEGAADVPVPDVATMDVPSMDLGRPDAGDLCTEPALFTLSPDEAVVRAAELMGQVVEVVGTATVGEVVCTDDPCPSDNPCCNRCRAPLLLGDLLLEGSICTVTATVGCEGRSCDPLVCSPPLLGISLGYVGVIQAEDPPAFELVRIQP